MAFGRIPSLLKVAYDIFISKITHHHVPSAATEESIHQNRQEVWNELDASSGVALEDHVRAFGYSVQEEDGRKKIRLDSHSMYTAMVNDLKIPREEAETATPPGAYGAVTLGVGHYWFSLCKGIEGYLYPEEITSMRHPHDSGFFNKDGTWNAKRFAKVYDYAISAPNGKFVITEARFQQCIKDLNINDFRWEYADFIQNKTGELANKGEVKQLFRVMRRLGEYTKYDQSYVAVDDIEEFLRHTTRTMMRFKNNQWTSFEPTLYDHALITIGTAAKNLVDECPEYHRTYQAVRLGDTGGSRGASVTDPAGLFCLAPVNHSVPAISGPQMPMLRQ